MKRRYKTLQLLGQTFFICLFVDYFYNRLQNSSVFSYWSTCLIIQWFTRLFKVKVWNSVKGNLSYKSAEMKYCPVCEMNIPEKDHHCWFLGCCISKKLNHTDFFLWLLWTSIACFSMLEFTVVSEIVRQSGSKVFYFLPGGFFWFILGYLELSVFLVLFRFYIYCAVVLFTVYMALAYFVEQKKGMQKYAIFSDYKSFIYRTSGKLLLLPVVNRLSQNSH